MNNEYKNTYVIDMDKVLANRDKYIMSDSSVLPIIMRNGQKTSKTEYISGCSFTCIEALIKQFAKLSKQVGKNDASTVVQYLDKSGVPIVTLYPTGDTDILNNKWANFALEAQTDLFKTQRGLTEKLTAKAK